MNWIEILIRIQIRQWPYQVNIISLFKQVIISSQYTTCRFAVTITRLEITMKLSIAFILVLISYITANIINKNIPDSHFTKGKYVYRRVKEIDISKSCLFANFSFFLNALWIMLLNSALRVKWESCQDFSLFFVLI